MSLRYGSLFTGIGGLDLGLDRAGWRCCWQVELSTWCRGVLTKHWPDVPRWKDVRDVRGSDLAAVDAIVGGFPCQDISQTGTGGGIDGARSGLWLEYRRLIGECRPSLVLIENVPRLLAADRGGYRVIADLAALGYVGEWDVVSAAALGAPHLRERVWIVAWDPQRLAYGHRHGLADERPSDDDDRGQPQRDDADGCGAGVARIFTAERVAASEERHARETWPRDDGEPTMGRTADGLPERMGVEPWERGTARSISSQSKEAVEAALELEAIGNAVCPVNAEHLGRSINDWLGI